MHDYRLRKSLTFPSDGNDDRTSDVPTDAIEIRLIDRPFFYRAVRLVHGQINNNRFTAFPRCYEILGNIGRADHAAQLSVIIINIKH